MPLPTPILDDRTFAQLRDELVRRIPVYTPEWTDHNPSDPGITLLELFAFLGENLLFRFNQIPESTKLAFLRLLEVPLRPAMAARTMIELTAPAPAGASTLVPKGTEAKAGSVPFETEDEVDVWPLAVTAAARANSADPASDEAQAFADAAIDAMGPLGGTERVAYYTVRELPEDPAAPGAVVLDFNDTVDRALWIAVRRTRDTVDAKLAGALVNIGFMPDEEVASLDDVTPCPGAADDDAGPEVLWHASTTQLSSGSPVYVRVSPEADSTRGLSRPGVVRLRLPADVASLGLFPLATPDLAGTRDFPPELEDAKKQAGIMFWLRATRRREETPIRRVKWIGVNATQVQQSRTATAEFLGTGTGQPAQQARLAHAPVLSGTLVVEVEERGQSGVWVRWEPVDAFDASTPDDRHYVVDLEAGTVRFGNGLRGRAPQIGERMRARTYRYGGGDAGNVAEKAITKLDKPAGVKANNPLRARGGAPGETVEEALERIPSEFRRHDRAVTESDFRELALATPGGEVARAECIPRFHPPSRDLNAAGIVTVVVWPRDDRAHPNAPMPDRTLLRAVCAWLDERRLVTTELWVIPPTYRKIAVALGVKVKPGYGIEAVRRWVELVVRQYLAPLPPYGPDGRGWPLGRRVHGPEIEAAALQVEGVEYLEQRPTESGCGDSVAYYDDGVGRWIPGTVMLERWEVPELATITVVEGEPLEPGAELGPPPLPTVGVPVPTIREEC